MKKFYLFALCVTIIASACACSTGGDFGSNQQNSNQTTSVSDISITSSNEQNSSISEDSSTSETSTDYKKLLSDSNYASALTDAAVQLDKAIPEQVKPDYSAGKGGDLDTWYELPYQDRYYYAISVINSYGFSNDLISKDVWEKWDAERVKKQNEATDNLDDYYGAWEYIKDLGLKYSDFKDEFSRVSGLMKSMNMEMSENDVKLLFEGTKEQINNTFLQTDYSLFINGKIYTPLVMTEKMSLESLIKAEITPDLIASKLKNVKSAYPDSSELNITEDKNTLYKKLCDDIYETVSKGEQIDIKSWISENFKKSSN